MKIWTSEHVFDHDWETVVTAAWRKYPNPMNQGVTGMDVLRQTLHAGKIMTERIIQSHFHIPTWVTKLTGFSGTQYSHEHTVIDPEAKTMSLTTRNLNGCHFLQVDERLTYTPLPDDPSKTILRQEASVAITLPAFADYCEKTFIGVYSSNAAKGRKGVEWVIDQLKKEYADISTKVSAEVHEMQGKVLNAFTTSPMSS
ncbi:hypothetical protein KIN20_002206 [Parelaphostrongylus tenuis]|uniref:PRELI/MSF1 domain-containing protein n=1 Tax=Parelaphostrongylus tenuis TaxID=148309 RepID=A0AAD5QDE3_PARTN|nr:hypothetical protein KIN20_002206 [Parelaphostrongylus tenuis]